MACKMIKTIPVYSPLSELSKVLLYGRLWKTFRCVSIVPLIFSPSPYTLTKLAVPRGSNCFGQVFNTKYWKFPVLPIILARINLPFSSERSADLLSESYYQHFFWSEMFNCSEFALLWIINNACDFLKLIHCFVCWPSQSISNWEPICLKLCWVLFSPPNYVLAQLSVPFKRNKTPPPPNPTGFQWSSQSSRSLDMLCSSLFFGLYTVVAQFTCWMF